jgi:N-acetylglucosamine-6-sulfatase
MTASAINPHDRRPSAARERRARHASRRIIMCAACLILAGCAGSNQAARASVSARAPAAATRAASPSASRPNIVFVLTDDLSWNLIPYMPHVLAMRRNGVSFSGYFVSDSLCCPSRSSILSGRLPHNTGVYSNTGADGGFRVFHARGEESDTFATALQKVGYSTALMGKYLNGYLPGAKLGGATPYVPPGWNEWDVAGDGYPEFNYTLNENHKLVRFGDKPQDYLTDVLARRSVGFIDRSADTHTPFMLEVSTFAPHAPFVPAPRNANSFPGLTAPRQPSFDAANIDPPAWLSNHKPLSSAQLQTINTDFRKRVQSVQSVDEMVGRIEDELKARGLARNTYIVFSSDNGLHMGEHRLMPGKLTAFDTDIRVPLIVTGPGVPAGRDITQLAENIDLCPTFETLGGAPVASTVDGHSLSALLHGQTVSNWRNAVLVEHRKPAPSADDPDRPTTGSGNPNSYEAIRTPTALYVQYLDGEREYYDLTTDPFELHNVVGELSPSTASSLQNTVSAISQCHGAASCWSAEHGSGPAFRGS